MKTIYIAEHLGVRHDERSINVIHTWWRHTTETTPTKSGPERSPSGALVMGPVIHDAEEVTL